MKCFYHNDLDGKCAAAIVNLFADSYKDEPKEFIVMDYDKLFPFDSIEKNEAVHIVDFSLQRDGDFERLLTITKNITWIDHHKTAIEKHKHICQDVKGIQITGEAGCVLAWRYYQLNTANYYPRAVRLLGDYDIWRFEYGDETRNFQAGMKLEDTHPISSLWHRVFTTDLEPIDAISTQGEVVRKYQQKHYAELVRSISFYAEFEGYRCICCNNARAGSQLFDSIDSSTYDFMMPFYRTDRGWMISLYNIEGIDGTKIAKKYGGGGHPGACGFQCAQLNFKNGKIEVVI